MKTAYEVHMIDWSSDVCSSDLFGVRYFDAQVTACEARDQVSEMAHRCRQSALHHCQRQCAEQEAEDQRAERQPADIVRSGERREGKEWGSTSSSRGVGYHKQKNVSVYQ